jgi:hypothetical protein
VWLKSGCGAAGNGEVEPAVPGDYEFAVEHGSGGDLAEQAGDDLGEVAGDGAQLNVSRVGQRVPCKILRVPGEEDQVVDVEVSS